VTTNGRPFVDTVADLVAGDFWYPPQTYEDGRAAGGLVVTGTAPDGTAFANGGDFCGDYAVENVDGVSYGLVEAWGEGWTQAATMSLGGPVACDAVARLYCFQIDNQAPLEPNFPPTRKVFVSRESPSPTGGIAALDAVCEKEASDAGLSGTFKTFLSTTSSSAASRFDLTGDTWGHQSGLPIVTQASDIATADSLLAPIQHFADGSSVQSQFGAKVVYTGAPTPSDVGTDASTCNNWSVSMSGVTRQAGLAGSAISTWWDYPASVGECNTWEQLYCFEE
jgi:hypothetical protein